MKVEVPVIPPTFYCVGLNYAEHIREVAAKQGIKANLPTQPDVGYRAVNALIAHGEEIILPPDATAVQYEGELVVVGRTSPLTAVQAEELAAVLTPAGNDHPWPERIGTGRFGGGRLSVPLVRVAPSVVVEVSADAALQAGVFRHPLRYLRIRPDLAPQDLPPLP